MENFCKGWWGWIRSSQGCSVRLIGRTNLEYRDHGGALQIPAETTSKP